MDIEKAGEPWESSGCGRHEDRYGEDSGGWDKQCRFCRSIHYRLIAYARHVAAQELLGIIDNHVKGNGFAGMVSAIRARAKELEG